MQAQEQARKLGPRSPTPTRSGTRPEPPPVCVLFPRPGIVLLSPTQVRLSSATPLPRCSPPSPAKLCGAGVPGTDLGAGPGGQCLLPAPLPSQALRPLGRDCSAHFFSAHFGAYCSALAVAHLCLETFLPGIVRSPTPQPLMDDRQTGVSVL